MDKLAQKRSLLNKLDEFTNLSGRAAEKFFNKEFEKAVIKLRQSDDAIRSIMLGKKIGESIGADANHHLEVLTPMKDLLAKAKSSMNQREYIDSFTELGQIHQQLTSISSIIDSLNIEIKSVHDDMLVDKFKLKEDADMTPKEKEEIENRRRNLAKLQKRLADKKYDAFVKEAGLMDFFKNISHKRGRALMAWEKKYPEEVSKWKNGTSSILDSARNIYSSLIEQLKVAAKARAGRNLDDYLNAMMAVKPNIEAFDKNFRTYYNNAVKPLLEKLKLDDPATVSAPSKTTEVPSEIKDVQVVTPTPSLTDVDGPNTLRNFNAPAHIDRSKPEPDLADVEPETLKDQALEDRLKQLRNAHADFMKTLQKMSGEDPKILKLVISKYAKSIQSKDIETSIKLFSIAKRIGN